MNNSQKSVKIAVNKSLLKEYVNSSDERVVYLNDGQEFQIQLHNPYSFPVGVEIILNGQASKSYLVLRPAERVWLDRHLDKAKKFKFSTYFVEDTEENNKAIDLNGKLVVNFYAERVIRNFNSVVDRMEPSSTPWWKDGVVFCEDYKSPSLDRIMWSSCNLTSSSMNAVTPTLYSCAVTQATASTELETGRIEEGRHSNQEFNSVNKDFEYYPTHTEIIRLLPPSRKLVTSGDLKKRWCHNCGRKLSQKYKFCPFCGTKI